MIILLSAACILLVLVSVSVIQHSPSEILPTPESSVTFRELALQILFRGHNISNSTHTKLQIFPITVLHCEPSQGIVQSFIQAQQLLHPAFIPHDGSFSKPPECTYFTSVSSATIQSLLTVLLYFYSTPSPILCRAARFVMTLFYYKSVNVFSCFQDNESNKYSNIETIK